MNSSSNTNISSKYNLPKFRISSADINSTSLDGFRERDRERDKERDRDVSRTSHRTLSASTVVSTPSNRRRIKNKLINKSINSKIPNGKLSKSKVLNLQQSKIKFNLNHDWDLNKLHGSNYDYSVFTSYPNDSIIPPTIKQSQINAWESAENITRNLIFNESDDDDDEDIEQEEDGDEWDITNIIKSIPGYSQGELQIILNAVNQKIPAKQEKSQLYDYKYNLQINQQNLFNQSATFQLKRQVQINQKKFLLRTLFGYSNNLNINYITNNTNYSAIDNSINIQKTFHEDKDEINLLLTQKGNFEKSLSDTNHKSTNDNRKTNKKNNDIDESNLLKINLSSAKNLSKYYYNFLNDCDDELNNVLLKDDLAPLLLNQLRFNVRHDD